MKATLMRKQLRRGDILNRNGVVRSIRNHGIAVRVVVYCRQQGIHACKHRVIDL
jgi:hypothetical protein